MHRLHIVVQNVRGPMRPQGERAAITQKKAKEAVNRKGKEEARRMGVLFPTRRRKRHLVLNESCG